MTKKLLCIILALAMCLSLFAACGDDVAEPIITPEISQPAPDITPEEAENLFVFTRENMPKMDGSTSLVPLSQAAASLLLGESLEDVEDLVQFNRTSQSYRNLMYTDSCDILIASVPSADVFAEMDSNNFEYEMEPIATDALIFVVNEGNSVDSLTTEQIIGIYTGEITNWSEVGGEDEPIAAFQRNSGAGSQALMEKLVMGDTPMMAAPTEFMAGSMGELMEYVRSYDNSSGAIGYSVYYYANDMRMAEGLKIIAVDGVEPTDDNIRDGAYPHLSNYYTVIAADEPADSPARIMFEWLQSAEGQRLVKSEGYVPVKDYEDFPDITTKSGYTVATHPEALSSKNDTEAKYSRLSEEHIDALVARDDYGTIYPYVGIINYYDYGSAPVYGLFDEQGRIICDCVYSEVSRLYYWAGSRPNYVPVLLLGRSINDGSGEAKMIYSFTTTDGSFVSPEYAEIRAFDFGILCKNGYYDQNFIIYDFEGNIIFKGSDMLLENLAFETVYEGANGYLLAWLDDGDGSECYLIAPDGSIAAGGWDSAEFASNGRLIVNANIDDSCVGLVDFSGNWIVPPEKVWITAHDGGNYYAAKESDYSYTMYDAEGTPLFHMSSNAKATGTGYIDGQIFYRFDGSSIALEGVAEWESSYYASGCPIIFKQEGDYVHILNTETEESLEIPFKGEFFLVEQLMSSFAVGPHSSLPYVMYWDGDNNHAAELISWDLEKRFTPDPVVPGLSMGAYRTITDQCTGEEYIAVYNENFMSKLYDSNMEEVADFGQWTDIYNGLIVNTDENFCTYTDTNGEVIFRYPLMINGD